MTFDRYVELAAAILAIVTAIGGVLLYVRRQSKQRERQLRLERHLREEKEWGIDQGQRTVPHLMAELGMTEKDVLDAAFRSKVVRRRTRQDDQGFARILLFEFDGDDEVSGGRPGRARL